jgi:hypothetical protein
MTHCRTILAAMFLAIGVAAPASADAGHSSITMPLADTWDWDWDGFRKFWRGQFGKTTGVVGATGVVVGIGVLIICSAKKKT